MFLPVVNAFLLHSILEVGENGHHLSSYVFGLAGDHLTFEFGPNIVRRAIGAAAALSITLLDDYCVTTSENWVRFTDEGEAATLLEYGMCSFLLSLVFQTAVRSCQLVWVHKNPFLVVFGTFFFVCSALQMSIFPVFFLTGMKYFLCIPQDPEHGDVKRTTDYRNKVVTQMIKMGITRSAAQISKELREKLQGLRLGYFHLKHEAMKKRTLEETEEEPEAASGPSTSETEMDVDVKRTKSREQLEDDLAKINALYLEEMAQETPDIEKLEKLTRNIQQGDKQEPQSPFKKEIVEDIQTFRRLSQGALASHVGAYLQPILRYLSAVHKDAKGRAMGEAWMNILIDTMEELGGEKLKMTGLDTTSRRTGTFVHNIRHLFSKKGVFTDPNMHKLFRVLEPKLLPHILDQLDTEAEYIDIQKKTADLDVHTINDVGLIFGEVSSSQKSIQEEEAALHMMAARHLSVVPVCLGLLMTADRRIIVHQYVRDDNALKIGITRYHFQFLPLDEIRAPIKEQIMHFAVNFQGLCEVLFNSLRSANPTSTL